MCAEIERWKPQRRKGQEVLNAMKEHVDKLWYSRHKVFEKLIKSGEIQVVEKVSSETDSHLRAPWQRDIWEEAQRHAEEIEQLYGITELGPWTDFEWGMLNGKVSTLRWVLGDDWDMLDT